MTGAEMQRIILAEVQGYELTKEEAELVLKLAVDAGNIIEHIHSMKKGKERT